MGGPAFASFDTPIGACGLAWRDGRLIGIALPESDQALLEATLTRRFPGAARAAMPSFAIPMAQAIKSHLSGIFVHFDTNILDLSSAEPFERLVYDAALAIPPGQTRTYGELAAVIGSPGAARAVGRALGRNPFPIVIPCHRILSGAGGSGGFSAPGGTRTKMRLLDIEQAVRGEAHGLFGALPWQMRP